MVKNPKGLALKDSKSKYAEELRNVRSTKEWTVIAEFDSPNTTRCTQYRLSKTFGPAFQFKASGLNLLARRGKK